MNIVVCYKIVPDEQDAQVQADRTLSFERAALKIGDYDLNAVEAGAVLAEKEGATLTCLTAGGDAVEDSKLKKAILARGPQTNVAVKDASLPGAGSAKTAAVLAAAVKTLEDVQLVLTGEGSADLYSQQVGIQLGEMLGQHRGKRRGDPGGAPAGRDLRGGRHERPAHSLDEGHPRRGQEALFGGELR